MRYVSRHPNKSEQGSVVKTNLRLLTRCEARGREVYTAGGQYLGLAENPETARLWGESPALLKLCKEAAEGTPPTRERFLEAVARVLGQFKAAP